jgi:hypothetical protein
MATNYKDIVITPSRGDANNDPVIKFSAGDATSNLDMNVRFYATSNGTMSFEGTSGQLFSVTNDLTGTIFSVNDISGIPSIEVDANGKISMAHFGGNVGIGTKTPSSIFDVNGKITGNNFSSSLSTNVASPSFAMGTTGIWSRNSSVRLNFAINGAESGVEVGTNLFALASTAYISWTSGTLASTNPDLFLQRDAANTIAIRNGTAPQTFNSYKTFTDSSNYERMEFGYISALGVYGVSSGFAGTGTALPFYVGPRGSAPYYLMTNSTARWQVSGVGHFIASTDNIYDIGTSGSNRPRSVYVSNSMFAPTYYVDTGAAAALGTAGLTLNRTNGAYIGWSNNNATVAPDTTIYSDGANTIAQRNGTAGQTYRLYGTYTDVSNYERLAISANSSGHYIIGEEGGTGSARPLYLGANNKTIVTIDSNMSMNGSSISLANVGPSGGIQIYEGTTTPSSHYMRHTARGFTHYYSNSTFPRSTFGTYGGGGIYEGLAFGQDGASIATSGASIGIPEIRTLALWTSNGTSEIERVRINASGNVGIGTTTPTAKLHVIGTANVTSNLVVQGVDVTTAINNANSAYAKANVRTLGITVDGSGTPLTTGIKGFVPVSFSGTIRNVNVIADRSGNISFDIWKTNNTIPNSNNSITGNNYIKLNNSQYLNINIFSSWSLTVNTGDVFGFNVVSANTLTRATLTITVD